MNKARLEAFSDGVFAIIITIMVLELKVPHNAEWSALLETAPTFISYLISFLFVGIYWGNHHHLLHTLKKSSSGILLANLNLLFWLSLVPFVTAWMGENHFAPNTIILYSLDCMLCGFAYSILQKMILSCSDPNDKLTIAIRKQNMKVIVSTVCALLAIPFAYVHPALSGLSLLVLSGIWLIPDKNIEKALNERE